jgi:hypothetical protein
MAERAPGRIARWLLPALIALPFVAAVVVDVVRVARRPPAVDRPLLEISSLRFDPAEPVFDLRGDAPGSGQGVAGPGFDLGSGWGQVTPEGRWTAAAAATLRLDLGHGGQRVLLVDGRADRGERVPVLLSVAVNGVDCGRARLERHRAVCRFALPEGVGRPGANEVDLELIDAGTGRAAEGRTALIRRLGLAAESAIAFDAIELQPALLVDREQGSVLIRRAGRFVASFSTPRSGSALSGRLRFREPDEAAWCRVVITRRYAGPERFDIVSERTLHASRSRTAKIRQELTDRQEPVALIVEVSPAAAAGGVLLDELNVEVSPKR